MKYGERISLYIFIDALGWEVLNQHPTFLDGRLVDRRPLDTILGYSSACDPSIISGCLPQEHGLWSSFFYAPEGSPFSALRTLHYLPSFLTNNHRIRNRISKWTASWHEYTGYFQLYNVPFQNLPLFDYAEKNSIWKPGGMAPTRTIFDEMAEANMPYFVNDAGIGDEAQFSEAAKQIEGGQTKFLYLLCGKLDALMHAVGKQHKKVDALMSWYDRQIRSLLEVAETYYEDVDLFIFSDHGMHDVTATVDLQNDIGRLGYRYGRDYVAFYDSTMVRFWFLSNEARGTISEALNGFQCGRVLNKQELMEQGVWFDDGKYGELIFLLDPGVLVIPSFMGRRAIAGMHGYDPMDSHSLASICANQVISEDVTKIHHIHGLMQRSAFGSREVLV